MAHGKRRSGGSRKASKRVSVAWDIDAYGRELSCEYGPLPRAEEDVQDECGVHDDAFLGTSGYQHLPSQSKYVFPRGAERCDSESLMPKCAQPSIAYNMARSRVRDRDRLRRPVTPFMKHA
jgi:hypothetical protein